MKRAPLPDNLLVWTPQHQRWWTEFTVTATLVLAACAGAFVALCFNDWSRALAALGVG